MGQTGQLSFDFYFAIMFAIIISQQLFTVSDQFKEASNETSILAQERQIANNVAAVLASSSALGDGIDFEIEYSVPAIFDIENRNQQSCDIFIEIGSGAPPNPNPWGGESGCNCGLISVYYPDVTVKKVVAGTYGLAGQPIKIITPTGTQTGPFGFKCGDKIKIKKG